jgi:DNA-binding SARP family transcriptional activator/Tfp pilus assembly protein PilF
MGPVGGGGRAPGVGMAVELRLLGPVEAWAGGQRIELGPRQQRLVLAILALDVNRLVPVDRLVELIWPVRPPRTALHAVHVLVSGLRAALARAAAHTADDAAVELVGDGSSYGLRAEPHCVDAHRFRHLVGQARTIDRGPERVARLDEALALWVGPALAGTATPEVRDRLCRGLEEARLAAIEDRLDARLGLSAHREVLDELTGLVAAFPLRERLVGLLMVALYRCGRAGEALEVYRQTRQRLADGLGLDPGADLRDLELAILRLDPALDAPLAPAGGAAPGTAAGPEPVPRSLPRDVAAFTGRDDCLERLDSLLPAGGAAPVVAITGLAGTGKTAIAVHWAYRVADRFPDGQLYLDLSGYRQSGSRPAARALAVLLRSLGVPADQVPPAPADAVALYRSMLHGRRVLLLLDNASTAAQVRPLLPPAPGCMAVVIGRRRLDGLIALDQAHHLAVGVLAEPEAIALLATFAGAQRITADPRSAVRLSRLCGQLPLALSIVGAQLTARPQRTLREQAEALSAGDRLSALAVEDDEQAAVRAAFTDSYLGLPAELRTAFRRLSLHPGRVLTPAAAAALVDTDASEALTRMERLGGVHMIESLGSDRFAFHDLLRLFGHERAATEDGNIEQPVRRLADWYLRSVDAAARRLYPQLLRLELAADRDPGRMASFDSDAEVHRWLDTERDNIVAVIDHAAGSREPETAWLLADAIRGHLQVGRYLSDMLAVSRTAFRAAQGAPARVRAITHLSLANAYRHHGDVDTATEHLTHGLRVSREAGWLECEAAVHGSLGNLRRELGELDRAVHHYQRSLEIFRRTGQLSGQAISLGNLGAIHCMKGRLAEAAADHAESLALHRAAGSQGGEALALANLGVVHRQRGQLVPALEHLQDALALFRRIGDRAGEAGTLEAVAAVHRDGGRPVDALEYAHAALDLSRAISYRRTEADALNMIGTIRHGLDDSRGAIENHLAALRLARQEAHHHDAEVTALLGLADSYLASGEYDLAADCVEEAVVVAARQSNQLLKDQAHAMLARVRGDRLSTGTPG